MRPVPRDWGVTHCGAVRASNEDALVRRADAGLWAVADGAGGHQGGEIASGLIRIALEAIPAALRSEEALTQVRISLAAVHDALRIKAAADRPAGGIMASTVVVLLIRAGHFVCLWAGDSRAYLLRDGSFSTITRDHSLVRMLVDSGQLTPAEAENHPNANIITRAVGADDPLLELEKVTGQLVPGDRFLLCTDGLCKTLDEATLAELVASDTNPAERLVEAALQALVRDNVTAVVIDPGPEEPDTTVRIDD